MREYREARKELSGDTEAAAPYIGVARVLLGQLKNRMDAGALQQGASARTLPDGTTVRVESRFGQDKITVTAAAAAPETPESSQPALEEPLVPPESEVPAYEPVYESTHSETTIVLCNSQDDSGNITPYLWTPKGDVIPVPIPAGATSAAGMSISANGKVIVGFCTIDGFDYAFRSTLAGGAELLPSLYSVPTQIATGVNHDGSVIVGTGINAAGANYINWVWTRAAGVQELPGSYWETGVAWGSPCISPNGRFIAGTRQAFGTNYDYFQIGVEIVLVAEPYITPGGTVWTPVGGAYVRQDLPPSGLLTSRTIDYFGTRQFTYTNPREAIPTDVSNTGVVVGAPGFRWRASTGMVLLTSDPVADLHPVSVVEDGGRAVAVTRVHTSIITTSGGNVTVPGEIYDIGVSGTSYVGGDGGPTAFVFHAQSRMTPATLWRGGKPTALPIPGPSTWAESIAMSQLDVSSDPLVTPKVSN